MRVGAAVWCTVCVTSSCVNVNVATSSTRDRRMSPSLHSFIVKLLAAAVVVVVGADVAMVGR